MLKLSLFKIASLCRWKGTVSKYTQKMQSSTIFNRRTPHQKHRVARSILNYVLNNSLTDRTDIAFDLVNEIVNSSLESAQKSMAYSGRHVNKKTFI